MEWLKSVPSSSSGPPPMPVQQPIPSEDEQRRIQQMLLAMHNIPPAGTRWAAPPLPTAGHVAGMPRPAAVHPGIQHANHVGAQSVDSAVEHSVSLQLVSVVHYTTSALWVVLRARGVTRACSGTECHTDTPVALSKPYRHFFFSPTSFPLFIA